MSTTMSARLCIVLGLLLGPVAAYGALVHLEWQPPQQTVNVGDSVFVALWAVPDGTPQSTAGLDAILAWDPASLLLQQHDDTGAYAWQSSSFPNDGALDGLNNTWADGDALYTALAPLGNPAWLPPTGVLVTTFEFTALALDDEVLIEIPALAGQFTETAVYDGLVPGLPVTGDLGSASVTIVPEPTGALTLAALLLLGLAARTRVRERLSDDRSEPTRR